MAMGTPTHLEVKIAVCTSTAQATAMQFESAFRARESLTKETATVTDVGSALKMKREIVSNSEI